MTTSAEPSPPARHARAAAEDGDRLSGEQAPGRLPDFFLVGHSKSGTTALYEMLRRHPRIFMPDLKEPVFFAQELPRQAHRYEAPATLEEYTSLFAPAEPGQLTGEASASYLWSRTAAERIARAQPDARIIAILREPASFLRSLHLQCVQSHYETEKDLRRALDLEESRREGRNIPPRSLWPQVLLYSEHVRYVEQLRRYHERFAPEQVLVLIYDDFRSENEATVRRVLRFLDMDDAGPVETVEANPTLAMRSQRLDELVHAVSVGAGPASRAAKAALKALMPQRIRRPALKAVQRRFVVAEPEEPDADLMLELRHRFRGEVLALSEYLDRDLITLWGYDSVA
jgi:hypothetical protein